MGRIIIGVLLILIGISALTGLALFRFAFAAFIIVLGVRILMGREGRHKKQHISSEEFSTTSDDLLNEVAIFSPLNKRVTSQAFKGGKVVVVFGGGDIDLTKAVAAGKDISLEYVAICGGGRIIIPIGWRVRSQATSVLGGFTLKAESNDGEVTLHLKGVAILGGVEVVTG